MQVKQTGYKITSIDLNREWINIAILHIKECPKSELHVSSITNTSEIYTEVGVIKVTKRVLHDTCRKLKIIILEFSKQQLQYNRREHVRMARNMPD